MEGVTRIKAELFVTLRSASRSRLFFFLALSPFALIFPLTLLRPHTLAFTIPSFLVRGSARKFLLSLSSRSRARSRSFSSPAEFFCDFPAPAATVGGLALQCSGIVSGLFLGAIARACVIRKA